MIEVIKYTADKKTDWDTFVSQSKNGTFLFYRDYMEYHSDRFDDFSLMIYFKNKLLALLPANIVGDTIYSHQGLTFGGFIVDNEMKASLMLDIFDKIKNLLSEKGKTKLIYKCVPHIYHNYTSEEDLYALFRNNAKLIRRDISTTILLSNKIDFSNLRKRKIKQALKSDLQIEEQNDFDNIFPLLQENLKEKHNSKPVHTQEELNYLKSKFQDNIHFYICKSKDGNPIAGTVVYESKNVAHLQYICSNEEGRNVGAIDFLFNFLINTKYSNKAFFDFGISTENNGLILNEGLIAQKEMFGGRGICYDTYELDI